MYCQDFALYLRVLIADADVYVCIYFNNNLATLVWRNT